MTPEQEKEFREHAKQNGSPMSIALAEIDALRAKVEHARDDARLNWQEIDTLRAKLALAEQQRAMALTASTTIERSLETELQKLREENATLRQEVANEKTAHDDSRSQLETLSRSLNAAHLERVQLNQRLAEQEKRIETLTQYLREAQLFVHRQTCGEITHGGLCMKLILAERFNINEQM